MLNNIVYVNDVVQNALSSFGHLIPYGSTQSLTEWIKEIGRNYDTSTPQTRETVRVLKHVNRENARITRSLGGKTSLTFKNN